MTNEEVITYIKDHFPTTPTDTVAKDVGLSTFQVRTIAKNHRIHKCKDYIKQQKTNLVRHRKKWFEDNIPSFNPTFEQEQIIFGSMLGDGYISRGAARSINYYYQEHFGEKQKEYRQWKEIMLQDLSFTINGNFLRSTSHPYFTNLHDKLYKNSIKILTKQFLSKCTHPLFLTALYLDDGSLTISYTYNKKKNIVYCSPVVTLHTLNFTKEENELLASHLNKTFQTNFVISTCPDGNRHLLTLYKESEVSHLLRIIAPYVKHIPSMKYKTSIAENVRLKTPHIKEKFNENVIIKISSSDRRRVYTDEEIKQMLQMKEHGATDQDIADALGRTYWSVVYKLGDFRKRELL